MKAFWNERFLVLREKQLDFLKSSSTSKTTNIIYLKDVSHVTRSDNYPFSLELTREGNKVWILKFDTDTDVYNWMDSIYDRCPQMGGVSHPTGFSHRVHVGFDPVTGGFVGLPVEWERLLKGSALTKDDMAKNPEAVMEVLQFYHDKLQVRAEDPKMYPSLTPTPGPESGANKQLGYSNGVAPPRPPPPGVNRQDSYQSGSSQTRAQASPYGSGLSRDQSADRYGAPKRADTAQSNLSDEERRRRAEEQKRRAEADRRRQEEDQERKRRQEQEDREYNESLPKAKVPLVKQEIGGGYGGDTASRDASPAGGQSRYNAQRPAPSAPSQSKNGQSGSQLPIRNLQAQRAAPAPPGSQNGSTTIPAKRPDQPGQYAVKQPTTPGTNGQLKHDGATLTRDPVGPGSQHKQAPSSNQVKPLNVATKQPSGKPDAVRQAEAALTKKDPSDAKQKDVRMSAMSDAQVMDRLRSVVTLSNPLESYNKQKKIGQGASGSVYVARIRENAPSKTAQDLLKRNGPRAQVAIKQMDLRSQPRKELIVNEIIVMKESRHDNIVDFLDAFLQEETFELWVVMEFMEGGALTDVIDNNAAITEDQIATICHEVSHLSLQVLNFSH